METLQAIALIVMGVTATIHALRWLDDLVDEWREELA